MPKINISYLVSDSFLKQRCQCESIRMKDERFRNIIIIQTLLPHTFMDDRLLKCTVTIGMDLVVCQTSFWCFELMGSH